MLEILSRRRLIRGAAGASLASLLPGAARAQSMASDAPWQVSPEARLRELGIELHVPPPPVATYVGTVIVGNMLYVAGHTPRMPDASPGHQGIVGQDLTVEQGQAAARQCGINILATMRARLGSLDRVAHTIEPRHHDGREGQIRIAGRIRRSELDSLRLGAGSRHRYPHARAAIPR